MADLHHLAAEHTVIQEIRAERARQDAKWGEQNHPDGTGPTLMHLALIDEHLTDTGGFLDLSEGRELGKAAEAATSTAARGGGITWRDILLEEVFEALAEEDAQLLRAELVQVAAVAVAWVETIDRRLMDEVHAERAERRA